MINPSDIPGIGLFDMDKASIETFGPVVHLDRNGFLYCTRGRIDLALNERVYEIRTGDIYIYPPFSHTYIHEISDDLQCVVGVADFDFVLPVINQVSNARNQVFILDQDIILFFMFGISSNAGKINSAFQKHGFCDGRAVFVQIDVHIRVPFHEAGQYIRKYLHGTLHRNSKL